MAAINEGQSAVCAHYVGPGAFQVRIDVRGGSILADEPVEAGGNATGPTPYELLSAALAACTTMTLRLYAERKGWDLPPFHVEVAHFSPTSESGRDRFERRIVIEGDVDPERRERLLEIAGRCPVHRTLMRGFEIMSSVTPVEPPPTGEPPSQHLRDMAAACED
jgi:putative redox protein